MPELKHNFMKGRMNKDLDERLVPNGEYRDALNVEVLTSESGDIGSVQNCLGNAQISTLTEPPEFISRSTCVGSIADNKTNKAYWLVAGPPPERWVRKEKHKVSRDFIAVYDSGANPMASDGGLGVVLNDIYNVRDTLLFVDNINNQIEVESTGGLRVGMQMLIEPITPTGTIIGVGQAGAIVITDIISSIMIEVNQLPYGIDVLGSQVSPTIFNTWLSANFVEVNFFAPRVLNFNSDHLITGINIVDKMLFWTDGHTEPKKINIDRCFSGTNQLANVDGIFWQEHTNLIVENNNKGPIKERHITNIKRAPLSPPVLEMSDEVDRRDSGGNIRRTTSQHTQMNWWGTLDGTTRTLYPEGTTTSEVAVWTGGPQWNSAMLSLAVSPPTNDSVDWRKGDIIILTDDYDAAFEPTSAGNPIPRPFSGDDIKIKLLVTRSDSNDETPTYVWSAGAGGGNLEFEILAINQDIPDKKGHWYMRLESREPIYEFKFPKFAYRYKYEDGEYSAFSPFSELAFLPDRFNYHPKEGYNLGMTNNLRELTIRDFVPKDIPIDVVEVDLLYKESDSPNIYTIKTFNSSDLEWTSHGSHTWDRSNNPPTLVPGGHHGNFKVAKDLIHAVVESNQFLRPWDNVPRKARAQELTANRIVYGNYQQNYNVQDPKLDVILNTGGPYVPGITTGVYQFGTGLHGVAIGEPIKSLKSLRSYQVGVVYKDFYGRETPVLSDYKKSSINVEKWYANKSNRLQISVKTDPPNWADSFKYFVKETSNEYYNLALDRWYSAGDENVWLSFPSEDRNKVDDETTIILKKGDRRHDFVEEAPKYKILAIENNAPDYIKTVYTSMGYIDMKTGISNSPSDPHGEFYGSGNTGSGPFVGRKNVRLHGYIWDDSDLSSLQTPRNTVLEGSFNEMGTSLVLRFLDGEPGETGTNPATQASKWYNITNIAANPMSKAEYTSPDAYTITIDPDEHDGGFGDDILFLGNDATPNTGNIIDNIHLEIGKKTIENKPEFDGRFFVKIHDDISIQSSIKQEAPSFGTNNQLVLDEIVNLNYFRGPEHFTTAHDSAPTSLAGTFPPGAEDAHNIQWDLKKTKFEISTQQAPHYNTDSGCTPLGTSYPFCDLYPPNSFVHGGNIPQPQSSINGYIGATPVYDDGSGGEWQIHEVYWEENANANQGANAYIPTDPTGAITMDKVIPQTHRYPGSEIGFANSVLSGDLTLTTTIGSQALLQTPYRAKSDWISLVNVNNSGQALGSNWFIDSEPALLDVSRNVYTSGTNIDDTKVNKFEMFKTVGADIGQSTIDISYVGFGGGLTSNWNLPPSPQGIANRLIPGTIFQFTADPENIKYEIGSVQRFDVYNYDWVDDNSWLVDHQQFIGDTWFLRSIFRLKLVEPGTSTSKKIGDGSTGSLTTNDIYSPVVVHDVSGLTPPPAQADEENTCGISFFIKHEYHQKTRMPKNPAVFETEPKEDIGLDIYYEISKSYPITMNDRSNERYIPINAHTDLYSCPHTFPFPLPYTTNHSIICGGGICPRIIAIDTDSSNPVFNGAPTTRITWDVPLRLGKDDILMFTTPDSTSVTATVAFDSGFPGAYAASRSILLDSNVHGEEHIEGWNNCYSWGNGVESNRIRDLYNTVVIDKGVKASTTLAEQYNQETRGSGLIFSGIYNSKMKGINRLNQFIMAEPITKELNPTYGSIQKLHQRDTDLITLCEDKVLRILSNKDALYNAEGNPSITSSQNVLGQAIPYLGEYGISKNPESFASEAFRFYFADKQRGAVLRLSRDGLTPISDYGMKKYFNDNLEFADTIVGSYDTVKSLYNISLFHKPDIDEEGNPIIVIPQLPSEVPVGNTIWNVIDFLQRPPTISFRDQNNGWTSFKSFRPETGLSLNNKYYTTKLGELWEQHSPVMGRGSNYSRVQGSTITVLLNDHPSSVKSFTTLNYEGSQSRVIANNLVNDGGDSPWTGQYYNSTPKAGWWCENITTINEVTGNQTGTVKEFINKEGKWFNHIHGERTIWRNYEITAGGEGNVDTQEFSVQGIGNLSTIEESEHVPGHFPPA